MDLNQVLIGFGVVIIIIAALLAIRCFKKKKNGKEEAINFLQELESDMYDAILQCIKEIEIGKFDTLAEYEKAALDIIYDRCWKFIRKNIEKAESDNLLTIIALKFLTRENIDSFIEKVMNEKDLLGILSNEFGATNIENKSESYIETDKELENKFSSEEYVEDSESMELPAAEEIVHTDEEIAKLNPQQDIDAEIYESDDESVEEVSDYIIKRLNRAGKQTYTLVDGVTGKKKQVSKQYASESGLDIMEE